MIVALITWIWQRLLRPLRSARIRRATAAAALVLGLSVSEPLLCIIHCQLWLPVMLAGHTQAQEQHVHNHTPGMAMPDPATLVAASLPFEEQALHCDHLGRTGNAPDLPYYVPDSPIHDALIMLGFALIAIHLLTAQLEYRLPFLPSLRPPPQLRPPIPV